MAGSRTLKLALLADIADFSKNINTAGTQSQTLGDQFEAFGKRAALAFAAAAAAIGAYAAAAIKNAAADEAAQRNLALTIENTTSATSKQIAGVEDYISKTSLAIGVTDDQLRPAFGRLVRSTKDVEEAQKLLNLALDISSATGKPLETVANALGKAYDGNLASLGKLGLGLDASILKSKDFDLVFQSLTGTFGGFADNEAQSTEKAFARIKIASDEVQEQIGTALLPLIQELTTFILTDVVPVIQQFVNGLTGVGGLSEGLSESEQMGLEWGKRIRNLIGTVIEFKDELIAVAGVIATVFVVSKISAAVTATIALIKSLVAAYNVLKASAIVTGVATAFALNPLLGVGAVALAAGVLAAANALANSSTGETNFAVGGAPGYITGGSGNAAAKARALKEAFTPEELKKMAADDAAKNAAADALRGQKGGVTGNIGEAMFAIRQIETGFQVPTITSPSGGFTDSQNAARLAAAASPTFNITVTGAIDKEGTARTIVETLNDSYYRGTGGAGSLVSS